VLNDFYLAFGTVRFTLLGLSMRALRIKVILQTVLVFLGANVAWLLLFADVPGADGLSTT
jgi:hypothetical protein